MRGVTHYGHEELILRDLLLRLEGDIRRRLAPLRVTPPQAGVLLFLRRHAEAKVTDAATALGVRLPTMMEIVKTLVRQGGSSMPLGQGSWVRLLVTQQEW
jgi:DNA-binding MarR family transcriptional regulator